MFAQVQVPKPDDPDHAITQPHSRVAVVDVFLFLPDDNGHVERDAVHVYDDPKHVVEHTQRQWQLEQVVDACEQFHARAVDGSQVTDVGGTERGYAQRGRSAVAGCVSRPALPPRMLGFVHQRLDVIVQEL